MSAAAAIPRSDGWPAPGPANGFCQVPHYILERIWRVCATPVEVGSILLIADQSIGYGREWAILANAWLAERLGVSVRAVRDAIEGAEKRGFIIRERHGQHNRYRVVLAAIRSAQDYEHPRPQVVDDDEDEARPAPQTRPVQSRRISYYGKHLKAYTDKDILIADQAAGTVAICGECQSVGIFEMVAEGELQIGDEKAKEEPQFRSSGKVQPIAAKSQDLDRGAPANPAISDERVKAVHRYLCTWREAFHNTPPTIGQARQVAAELGDAAIEYLDGVMQQRRRWIFERAEHYGAVKAFARQAREAYESEEGVPCPCGRTRLKHGQICAHCGPQPKRSQPQQNTRRAPDLWDRVKAALALRLTPQCYANWIEPTSLLSHRGQHLRVTVPDEATVQWIENEYGEQISLAVSETLGAEYTVEYEAQEDE